MNPIYVKHSSTTMKIVLGSFLLFFWSGRAWMAELRKTVTFSMSAVIWTRAPLATPAVDFSGSYTDPNHPNCQRVIAKDSGTSVIVSGTDGSPSCPPDGSGTKWQLSGTVRNDKILVDFSPKGGPKNLEGVYDAGSPPGIRWPDGNKWTLREQILL